MKQLICFGILALLISCSTNMEKTDVDAISVRLPVKVADSRTILPNDVSSMLESGIFILTGVCMDSEITEETELHRWENQAALKDAPEILISQGIWNFTLKLEYQKQISLSGTLSGVKVTPSLQGLTFLMQQQKTGMGTIDVTLFYPTNAGIAAVKAGLYSVKGAPELTSFEDEALNIWEEKEAYSGKNCVFYQKENILAGDYILNFRLYSDEAGTDLINLYSEVVQVFAGCTSKAERKLTEINTHYPVIYNNIEESDWIDASLKKSFFLKEENVELPELTALHRDGYLMTGWYSSSDCLESAKITGWNAGEHLSNVEIWAKWEHCLPAKDAAAWITGLSNGAYSLIVTGEWDSDILNNIAISLRNKTSVYVSLDFSRCTGMKELPDSVFSSCTGLLEIVLPDEITKLGEYAFAMCKNLKRIMLSDNVTSIDDCAFYMCASLAEWTFPENITELGGAVFSGTNIKEVNFPERINIIPSNLFSGCVLLDSVMISQNVTEIGSNAFYTCSDYLKIYFMGDRDALDKLKSNISDSKLKSLIYSYGSEDEQWQYDVNGNPKISLK